MIDIITTSIKNTTLRIPILSMVSQPIKDHPEETTIPTTLIQKATKLKVKVSKDQEETTDQTMTPIILTPMDTTTEENLTIINLKKRLSDFLEIRICKSLNLEK